MACERSRVEVRNQASFTRKNNLTTKHYFEPGESSRSCIDNDKPKPKNAFQDTVRPGRQSMDADRESAAQPKASEYTLEYKEQVRDGMQHREKVTVE
jgi:hypothetical protein